MGRYQKGKTNLDFTEARGSEWQWHQLGHMQVCTLLQTDNHASTSPLSFLQAGCPSCRLHVLLKLHGGQQIVAVIRAVDVLVNGNNGIAGRPAAGDIYLSAAASHS